jgi:hypothetical protein
MSFKSNYFNQFTQNHRSGQSRNDIVTVHIYTFARYVGCVLKSGLNVLDWFEMSTRVARFFLVQTYQNGRSIPKYHKLYQTALHILGIPNSHKLYQRAVKIYQHFIFQGPPKYTQIGIFGLKVNRLATLMSTCDQRSGQRAQLLQVWKMCFFRRRVCCQAAFRPTRFSSMTIAQSFSPFLSWDGRQVRRPDPTRATSLFSKI